MKEFKNLFVGILIALTLALSGCGSADSEANQSAEYNGTLSFKVIVAGHDNLKEPIIVNVSGETEDGNSVDEDYMATPGILYNLEYGPGVYTFTIDNAEFNGEAIIKPISKTQQFTGKNNETILIETELDEGATKAKLQEIEEKKASEEKAKQEAELKEKEEAERLQAEEEAALAAAAAAAARNDNQKETQNTGSGSGTVYIAASGNGTKYHEHATCSNMKGVIELTVSEAKSMGYEPCKKCY